MKNWTIIGVMVYSWGGRVAFLHTYTLTCMHPCIHTCAQIHMCISAFACILQPLCKQKQKQTKQKENQSLSLPSMDDIL